MPKPDDVASAFNQSFRQRSTESAAVQVVASNANGTRYRATCPGGTASVEFDVPDGQTNAQLVGLLQSHATRLTMQC